MSGSISGGDWGFPDNVSQTKVFFDSLLHTWTRTGNIFGTRQLGSSLIVIMAPLLLLAKVGISVPLIMKLFALLIFSLAGSNFNLLARYIGAKPLPAFIGGLIFILTPIFFNYSLMGWLYALLSLSLMPLFAYFFLRAVDGRDFRYAILSSIIFSLAIVQSQTVIWYSIILVSLVSGYGIFEKKTKISIFYGLGVLIVFLLLNSYWLIILLLFPDKGVAGSDMFKSTISIGTSDRLSVLNIIRGWGSLFNNQFEYSYPKVLLPFSFSVTILATASLMFIKSRRKIIVPMAMLFIISCAFFFIDRNLLSRVPFSNVIRDVARFSVLSTFSLSILATVMLDIIFLMKSTLRNTIMPIVIISLLLSAFPFYSGSLFKGKIYDRDFRLRTMQWPIEYHKLNEKLKKEDKSKRAIFFPIGGLISTSENKNFHGLFQEAPDVYAGFSPIAGLAAISDRDSGESTKLIDKISNQALKKQDVKQLMDLASSVGINYIVFRKDLDMFGWGGVEKSNFEQKLRTEVADGNAEIYYDEGSVLAISLKSAKPIISTSGESAPVITYKMISPAKYEIEAKLISGDFKLNFNESFSSYWKLVDKGTFFSHVISTDDLHSVDNGYSNSFVVKVSNLRSSGVLLENKEGAQSAKFYLVFLPERYVPISGIVSCATLFFGSCVILYQKKRLVKNKN